MKKFSGRKIKVRRSILRRCLNPEIASPVFFGPKTQKEHFQELDDLHYKETQAYYAETHLRFKRQNKIDTLIFISNYFILPLAKFWDKVKRKKFHSLLVRLYLNVKYPVETLYPETQYRQMSLRYKELRSFENNVQSYFQMLREIRDAYVYTWIYENVVQRIVAFLFLSYVYEVAVPRFVALVLKSILFLSERFTFLPILGSFFYFCGITLVLPLFVGWLAVYLVAYAKAFYDAARAVKKTRLYIFIAYIALASLVALPVLFLYLLIKCPFYFVVGTYFISGFQFNENR